MIVGKYTCGGFHVVSCEDDLVVGTDDVVDDNVLILLRWFTRLFEITQWVVNVWF